MSKPWEKQWTEFIVCEECGYNNIKHYVDFFETCNCCNKVLNEKAKFKYEMNKKLGLWRKDKEHERRFIKNNHIL